MSRIVPVDPMTAVAPVKTLLEGVQRGLGVTPNLFRVAGRSPAALDSLVGLFGATAKGRLGARTREAIALAVSEANACDYCLSAHTALGRQAGLDEAALDKAREATADDPHLQSILRLARAIVDHRGRVGGALDAARSAGVGDDEVVEIVANVALTIFTNYLNELAETEIDFPEVRHRSR